MGDCPSYHLLPLLIISPAKVLENKGERGRRESDTDRMTEERNKEAERVDVHCSSPPRVTSSKTLAEMEKFYFLFVDQNVCTVVWCLYKESWMILWAVWKCLWRSYFRFTYVWLNSAPSNYFAENYVSRAVACFFFFFFLTMFKRYSWWV